MRLLRGQWLVWPAGGVVLRALRKSVAAALMLGVSTEISQAADVAKEQEPEFTWREMWLGADATKNSWLIYTGVTLAPLSKDVYSDGLRLRVNSGYGQYNYSKVPDFNDKSHCRGKRRTATACIPVDVSISYVDALVGYQMRFGQLTAKVFAGLSTVDHGASIKDANNHALGREYGATGALEFWLNVGDHAWTSLDLSYTTAHDTAAARWRAGWRALPTLSIGPEMRFDRNEQSGSARAGAFARYEWVGGEISAAAGIARVLCDPENNNCNQLENRNAKVEYEPYATLNYLTQF
jgi:Cellulose biosynthesis protein BcsS